MKVFLSIIKKKGSTRNITLVNLLSFAVSIAVFVLIILYIQFELNFDKQLPKYNQMYRFVTNMYWESGAVQNTAVSPVAAAHELVKDIPEIEDATSFIANYGLLFEYTASTGEKLTSYENTVLFVDSVFPQFFPVKLKQGNAFEILAKPNVLILSEKKATEYFGQNNPVGNRINIKGYEDFEVAGIMKNAPENIHLNYDVLVSNRTLPQYKNPVWADLQAYTYIHIKNNASAEQIESKFTDLINKYLKMYTGLIDFSLQPVSEIHLHNAKLFDIAKSTDSKNIYFLSAISIFVLLIALSNFINLNSIIYQNRAKELGIRKLLGEKANSILVRFFVESGTLTACAVIISLAFIMLFFSRFKSIFNYSFTENYFINMPWILIAIVLIGAISGTLSIFWLNQRPSLALMNPRTSNAIISKTTRQKALVIFQFSLTTLLLISIMIIMKQLSFVNKKDLGFDKERVLCVEVLNDSSYQVSQLFKMELQKNSSVVEVGLSNRLPVEPPFSDHFFVEGFDKHMPLNTFDVDRGFLSTLKFTMLSGSGFSENLAENRNSCIINEAALLKFGWTADEAIGKKLSWNFGQSYNNQINGKVIGVVKDFNYSDMHNLIEPMVITSYKNEFPVITIKLSSDNTAEAINQVKKIYQQCNPQMPFNYFFLDQRVYDLYADDFRLSKLLTIFNILALIVSSIGLYNLASISIKKRVKEIGIRKINGAKVFEILQMLSVDFMKWVFIAYVIACPIAWYIMNLWLQNFAYKTTMSWWIFATAGFGALGIAMLTVSWQSWRAATRNPVEALRYE